MNKLAVIVLAAVLTCPVYAQTIEGGQTPVPSDSATKVAALEKQMEQLKRQIEEKDAAIGKMQQAINTSPEQVAKDTDNISVTFKTVLNGAFSQGCKKAGGKVILAYSSQQRQIVFDSCQF